VRCSVSLLKGQTLFSNRYSNIRGILQRATLLDQQWSSQAPMSSHYDETSTQTGIIRQHFVTNASDTNLRRRLKISLHTPAHSASVRDILTDAQYACELSISQNHSARHVIHLRTTPVKW
jgi:hypothetical protein